MTVTLQTSVTESLLLLASQDTNVSPTCGRRKPSPYTSRTGWLPVPRVSPHAVRPLRPPHLRVPRQPLESPLGPGPRADRMRHREAFLTATVRGRAGEMKAGTGTLGEGPPCRQRCSGTAAGQESRRERRGLGTKATRAPGEGAGVSEGYSRQEPVVKRKPRAQGAGKARS